MRVNLIKVKVGKHKYKPTKISLSAFNKGVKSGKIKHDYNEYYKSGGKTYKRIYKHNTKPVRRVGKTTKRKGLFSFLRR